MKDGNVLSIVTDIRGRRVPTSLAGPFMARERFARMVRLLEEIKQELAQMNVYGSAVSYMDPAKLDAMIKALQDELLENAPAIPCDCAEGCERCQQKRWLSAKDLREIANMPAFKLAEESAKAERLRKSEVSHSIASYLERERLLTQSLSTRR
jgi:hypothetical protein